MRLRRLMVMVGRLVMPVIGTGTIEPLTFCGRVLRRPMVVTGLHLLRLLLVMMLLRLLWRHRRRKHHLLRLGRRVGIRSLHHGLRRGGAGRRIWLCISCCRLIWIIARLARRWRWLLLNYLRRRVILLLLLLLLLPLLVDLHPSRGLRCAIC